MHLKTFRAIPLPEVIGLDRQMAVAAPEPFLLFRQQRYYIMAARGHAGCFSAGTLRILLRDSSRHDLMVLQLWHSKVYLILFMIGNRLMRLFRFSAVPARRSAPSAPCVRAPLAEGAVRAGVFLLDLLFFWHESTS